MNTSRIASRVLARFLGKEAMEFPTEKALKDYLHDHPGADKSNHSVAKGKGSEKGSPGTDDIKVVNNATKQLGNELQQWQGPGTPAINSVGSFLTSGTPVPKAKVHEAIKELGKERTKVETQKYKDYEKDIKHIDTLTKTLKTLAR